jgi:hypothetical protein
MISHKLPILRILLIAMDYYLTNLGSFGIILVNGGIQCYIGTGYRLIGLIRDIYLWMDCTPKINTTGSA